MQQEMKTDDTAASMVEKKTDEIEIPDNQNNMGAVATAKRVIDVMDKVEMDDNLDKKLDPKKLSRSREVSNSQLPKMKKIVSDVAKSNLAKKPKMINIESDDEEKES